jgi:small Trp-rich protein
VYFVVLGVLFLVMKLAEFGPIALWPWWGVLAPFVAAVGWWTFADKSGWTKRREIDKMEARKKLRRETNLEALGMGEKNRKKR